MSAASAFAAAAAAVAAEPLFECVSVVVVVVDVSLAGQRLLRVRAKPVGAAAVLPTRKETQAQGLQPFCRQRAEMRLACQDPCFLK